ncbi:peptidylprolyl isomerase [Shimia sp. FJ5]|uniref:peptidylprolyl isomerase n=1 Tax=Shimia sp. FJ5 TaxID=3079054 RepID=UPI00293DCB14|nr:peptidyl-prolyl cis-trans isomerase [Shimia sp. FJ5]MDV4145643.1 SurA N-terminal domain-containing protein [Shimia sp. FJ5]
MSKSSTSKTLVWILMAMLIFGLGGFGITNLGGSATSVGSVGDKEIDINEYARALQNELRAVEAQTGQSLSFADARAMGLDQIVLGNLVTTRALDAENDRLGISLGDARLAQELRAISAFKSPDGQFDREAYKFALEQIGMSEAEFETSMREESARALLQTAIVSGLSMPVSYGEVILNFVGEERDVTIARLDAEALAYPVATPSDDQLLAYYEANIDAFTRPAMREITYAWLSPSMLIDTVEIDEETLRALYEERSAEFNTPERRLVERLAFADMDAAEAARAKLDAGESSFEDLVAARGLELSDTDLGDVSTADLGAAGEAIFSAEVGSVAGPIQTIIGPALFRVNGVLPGNEVPFDEALPELREELAAERARRVIDSEMSAIDDLLAAGATLEELAKESDMQVDQISWHDGLGDGIAGYEEFRALAATLSAEDFPQIETLEDGGIFALRLDGETPAAPAPFDDVRDEVAAAWTRDETVRRLEEMAANLTPMLGGDADLSVYGLAPRTETGILRNGFVPDTPATFLETVFSLEDGAVATLPHDDTVLILRLDAVRQPDKENEEITSLANTLLRQAAEGIAQDVFQAYATEIQAQKGVTLDQPAINAVHAQFQ